MSNLPTKFFPMLRRKCVALRRLITVCGLTVSIAGCSKPKPEADKPPPQRTDACSLLTNEEIKSVQGELVVDKKPTGSATVSQCYFSVATPVNSVVLTVTVLARDAKNARPVWEKMFQNGGDEEDDRNNSQRDRESEARGSPRLHKVDGVGDEAFWAGNRFGGALHVLSANRHIRISIGGADEEPTKIKKSKALAEMALKRL